VTGINTVICYGSILFKEHGGSSSAASATGANVVIGTMNFLCTIVAIAAIAWLCDKGYDPRYGARPLRRLIEQQLENPIGTRILREQVRRGYIVLVGAQGGCAGV
jgi:hypothetical protein